MCYLYWWYHQGHEWIYWGKENLLGGCCLFKERALLAQTRIHHKYVQSIVCPHNKWEAHENPKILQHREVSVFADICVVLPCTSESPLMWLQHGTELSELPAAKGRRSHNPSRHPANLCRLRPQTSGLWRRTSKGPPYPQLAHCGSLPTAVKTINKDDQYCAMHCVWTQHIY